jgi:general secretion pathway protein G
MRNRNPEAKALVSGGHRAHRAFTLVELLLVLAILATLAAIVIPKFAGRSQQAKETAAKTQIGAFTTALDAFEVDNGYYPKTDEGLSVLVEEPKDAKNWKPYLNEIPNDPWSKENEPHPYVYVYPGKHNTKGYDIMSLGADGQAGTEDDITNWTKGK